MARAAPGIPAAVTSVAAGECRPGGNPPPRLHGRAIFRLQSRHFPSAAGGLLLGSDRARVRRATPSELSDVREIYPASYPSPTRAPEWFLRNSPSEAKQETSACAPPHCPPVLP